MINATPDGKQLSFHRHDINCMINSFHDGAVPVIVKITKSRLSFSSFSFSFLFSIFSIFRTWGLGLEVIGHTVTSVTSDGIITTLIMRLKRKK